MTKTMFFSNIDGRVKSCVEVFNEYRFPDLVRACFCIIISVKNRSCLESCLAVNELLLECGSTGTKRIDTYEEFTAFFDKISGPLQPGITDDLTIEDFGEVKIKFGDIFYDIITGTGHNQVFPCIYSLPYLAELIAKDVELKKVLEYHSFIISYFKDVNDDGDKKIQFVLPSKRLFDRTKNFFKSEIKKFDLFEISDLLGTCNDSFIEQRHFIEKDGNVYPIFNTAILVDLYNIWYKKLDEKQKNHVINHTVYNILNDYEQFTGNKELKFLFPVRLYGVDTKYKDIVWNFCACCEGRLILGINGDEIDSDQVEDIIDELLIFKKEGQLSLVECRSRNADKNAAVITVFPDTEVLFIVYDSYLNVSDTNLTLGSRFDKHRYFKCSGLDIIDLLLFADNADEIADFITYDFSSEYSQLTLFGGKSSIFFMWKQMDHSIAKGAVCFSFADFGYSSEEEFVYDYFKNELGTYPWDSKDEFLFSNPFIWNITDKEDGLFKQYVSKYGPGFGGNLAYFGKSNLTLFFPTCVEYLKDEPEPMIFVNQVIPIVEDILNRIIKDLAEVFDQSSINNRVLEIILMPKSYADKVSRGRLNLLQRKYAYSDLSMYKQQVGLRFFVDIDSLHRDIQLSEDRHVECDFIKEIFLPLKYQFSDFYASLEKALEGLAKNKKKVEVVSYKLDYLWNDYCNRYNVSKEDYERVRKHIAFVCLAHEIEPGEYYGKDANNVVRNIQQTLIEDFIELLKGYDQLDLHLKLSELYSYSIHTINLHRKRYNMISNVDEEVLSEVRGRIIHDRELEKHNSRTILYAIESNLWASRQANKSINHKELNYILAYANWLVVLNDTADMCNFTTDDVHINVTDEFVVDTCENEEAVPDGYSQRVYSDVGYALAYDDVDKECIEKLKEAFAVDTGFSMQLFFDFLLYLRIEINKDSVKELRPNVYSVDIGVAYKEFSRLVDSFVPRDIFDLMIKFLMVSPEKLMVINGEHDYFLPIGRKKDRDNRFDIKPVVRVNETIVYSSVAIYDVFLSWNRPFVDLYVPFEMGLSEVKKVLKRWKKVYEKRIVIDVEAIFKAEGIAFVKPNLELCKIDKVNNHPQWLGDYDVFAVDTKKHNIWMIECKVIEKVGTFFDMYMQQHNFFDVHKKDELFQRRIDYMKEHYPDIIKFYELPDGKYRVLPYMVMNKVLFSRYKEIKFPIISIGELKEEIRKLSNN